MAKKHNIDVTEEFINAFDANMDYYNEIISMYSGKHNIDNIKANEWILAQPTERSKNAARNLIKHTKYVTFNDLLNIIEELVIKNYANLVNDPKNQKKSIYLYVADKNKSNYFISCLAYNFMKKHNIKLPTRFISMEIDHFKLYKIAEQNLVIYFDDMAYSGLQIKNTITPLFEIYTLKEIIKNIKPDLFYLDGTINILNKVNNNLQKPNKKLDDTFFMLMSFIYENYAATNSYKYVKENFVKDFKQNYIKELKTEHVNGFNIFLVGSNIDAITYISNINVELSTGINIEFNNQQNVFCNKIYKRLKDEISEEEIFDMAYYFSYGVVPNVSIYYDHKIADMTSTFSKVLNYGPIVPDNYDISNYYDIDQYIKNIDYFIKDNKYPITHNYLTLFKKYYKNNKIENNSNITNYKNIQFKPFINNCFEVDKIIENQHMKEIEYLMFISDTHNDVNDKTQYDLAITHHNQLQYSYKKGEKPNKNEEKISFDKNSDGKIYNTTILDNYMGNDDENKIYIPLVHQVSSYYETEEQRKKTMKFLNDIDNHRCNLTFYKMVNYNFHLELSNRGGRNQSKKYRNLLINRKTKSKK
jgi:hypothetical protein